LDRIKLAQLSSPHGEVWQVTEPSAEASKHLKSLELKNPPAILHLVVGWDNRIGFDKKCRAG
ncbi:hypothetical protein C2W62_53545, partial [Candidatus Entotheonella serta]